MYNCTVSLVGWQARYEKTKDKQDIIKSGRKKEQKEKQEREEKNERKIERTKEKDRKQEGLKERSTRERLQELTGKFPIGSALVEAM